MELNIGTSGYNYKFWGPCSADKSLKPQSYYTSTNNKQWLKKYSKDLGSVEINCTRYKKLSFSTCEKWKLETPEDFTFTIKAPIYITHYLKLDRFKTWWDEFFPCIRGLGEKFKCILFQFPPTFKNTAENIQKIKNVKEIIPENIKCAFELRDLSWYATDLTEKLFQNNFTQVILAVPEVRSKKCNFGNLNGGLHIGIINTKFIYIRFHGTYDYSCGTYTDNLNFYSEIMAEIKREETETICAYFNNTDTWTLAPFSHLEGEFSKGIPIGISYTPSAIFDAICFRRLLSEN